MELTQLTPAPCHRAGLLDGVCLQQPGEKVLTRSGGTFLQGLKGVSGFDVGRGGSGWLMDASCKAAREGGGLVKRRQRPLKTDAFAPRQPPWRSCIYTTAFLCAGPDNDARTAISMSSRVLRAGQVSPGARLHAGGFRLQSSPPAELRPARASSRRQFWRCTWN